MRKVFIVLAGLLALLIAAIFIGPGFVNWNAYKGQIADAAYKATGRSLSIQGDISFSILPTPKLVVKDVGLANVDGGRAEQMVRLKSLDVQVSLAALISGNIQVQSVTLVQPVITLEVLADGRRNWDFDLRKSQGASQAGQAIPLNGTGAATATDSIPNIRLDRFIVTDGTLVYADAASGLEEKVTGLDAAFSAGSLEGPFESSGDATVRGQTITFAVSAGKMIENRTLPINANVQVKAGGAKVSIAGVILDLNKAPRFKGKVSVTGDDLAGFAAGVAGADLPPVAARSFSIGGDVNATSVGAEVRDVVLALGDLQGAANVNATFGDGVGVGAAVHFGHIDLDSLMATTGRSTATSLGGKTAKPVDATVGTSAATTSGAADGFSLPANIAASLALTVDALTVHGGTIRQAKLNAELVNGEITVSQAAAQLPGSTDVAVFGFLTAAKGLPRFEGELDVSVGDTRGVSKWLGVDMAGLSADRLRTVSIKGTLVATPERIEIDKLHTVFDGSTITGGLVAMLTDRPSFGVDVMLDKINLDAYLPQAAATKVASTASVGNSAKGDKGAAGVSAGEAWQAFAALRQFDANVKAHVKHAAFNGVAMRDTVLDGTLYDGALTLRRASVAEAAGAAMNVTGIIKGLGGVPDFEGLSVAMTATDPARLMALAGQDPSPVVKDLGAVKVAARLDGSAVRPALKATVDAAGGKAGFDGTLNLLPLGAGLKGTLSVSHSDMRALLTKIGGGYRPAGQPGALSLTGQVDATTNLVALNGMQSSIGQTTLGGDITVGLGGARPKVSATLTGGMVDLTAFEPAARRAAVPTAGVIPAAFTLPRGLGERGDFPRIAIRAATTASRWPTTPLDLSGLRALDADVALTAKALVFKGYRLDNADIRTTLADGVLAVSRLNGGLFGGALAGTMNLDGRGAAKAGQSVSLKGVDLAALTKAAVGEAVTSGTMDLDATLSAQGGSVADLMASLTGNGKAALMGMDIRKGTKASALAPIMNLFLGLNQLGGALTGGKAAHKADLTASFSGARGLFSSSDIRLSSGLGDGTAKAKVDLAGWRIEANGEVNMSRNVLGLLLSAKGNLPTSIPFSLSGPLDTPNVKIDSSLTKGGLPIPGVDKLLGGKGGAIGNVLKGILGGGATQSAPQSLPPKDSGTSGTGSDGTIAPPPPPPGDSSQQQQQQQKIDPRQLLKGLLGR